jgi:hypothetical protein
MSTILIALTSLLVLYAHVFVFEVNDYNNAETKTEIISTVSFNAEMLRKAAETYQSDLTLTENERLAHDQRINDIRANNDLSSDVREAILRDLGVHRLDNALEVQYASITDDVTQKISNIHYSSFTGTYYISSSDSTSGRAIVSGYRSFESQLIPISRYHLLIE